MTVKRKSTDKELKINAVLKAVEISTLYFLSQDDYRNERYRVARLGYKRYCTTHSLKEATLKTIEYMKTYCSMRKEFIEDDNDSEFRFETMYNKRRSVVDIWRHLKSPLPELSIIDVMDALYKLCLEEEVTTSFCFRIKRRTFRIGLTSADDVNSIYNADFPDEFGLKFAEWENR